MTHSYDEGRATAASTHRRGGARHDHDKQKYEIDVHLEKARRLALHLHTLDLYPSDRDLLIRLQGHIKYAKKINNYDPQVAFVLFDVYPPAP